MANNKSKRLEERSGRCDNKLVYMKKNKLAKLVDKLELNVSPTGPRGANAHDYSATVFCYHMNLDSERLEMRNTTNRRYISWLVSQSIEELKLLLKDTYEVKVAATPFRGAIITLILRKVVNTGNIITTEDFQDFIEDVKGYADIVGVKSNGPGQDTSEKEKMDKLDSTSPLILVKGEDKDEFTVGTASVVSGLPLPVNIRCLRCMPFPQHAFGCPTVLGDPQSRTVNGISEPHLNSLQHTHFASPPDPPHQPTTSPLNAQTIASGPHLMLDGGIQQRRANNFGSQAFVHGTHLMFGSGAATALNMEVPLPAAESAAMPPQLFEPGLVNPQSAARESPFKRKAQDEHQQLANKYKDAKSAKDTAPLSGTRAAAGARAADSALCIAQAYGQLNKGINPFFSFTVDSGPNPCNAMLAPSVEKPKTASTTVNAVDTIPLLSHLRARRVGPWARTTLVGYRKLHGSKMAD